MEISEIDIMQSLLKKLKNNNAQDFEVITQDCIEFIEQYHRVLVDIIVSLYVETRRIEKAARNLVIYFDGKKEAKPNEL